jgi:ribose transport system permease protein
MAGLAGAFAAARTGSVSTTTGTPYLLPAFAGCFLSATQIKPGRFNVWGLVISLYLLSTGVKGLQLAGGSAWITDMFNGVALIAAVALSIGLQLRRAMRMRRRTAARLHHERPSTEGAPS